jgi:hypothetical protein
VFTSLLDALPEVEARRHAGTAYIAWMLHDMFSKRRTRPSDHLPAFARFEEGSRIPSGLKRDLDTAARGGWLSQELIDAVTAVSEVSNG